VRRLSPSTGIRFSDRPSCSEWLYRLSYPVHVVNRCHYKSGVLTESFYMTANSTREQLSEVSLLSCHGACHVTGTSGGRRLPCYGPIWPSYRQQLLITLDILTVDSCLHYRAHRRSSLIAVERSILSPQFQVSTVHLYLFVFLALQPIVVVFSQPSSGL
jgi:hypothetical protein